jgi:hypothetical protein
MTSKLPQLLEELRTIQNKASVQALTSAPLARPLPSSAGNCLFGKTADLRAVVDKIRAVEASNPSLARYPATAFPSGNLCNRKDLENAQRYLAAITATPPRKPFSALTRPTAAKAVTSPAKAPTGRNAAELLSMNEHDQRNLIFAAMPLAARPLRDELRNAFKSAPAGLRAKFASTFRNALHAHERDQAPSISKQSFNSLSPQQKMDSIRAGIKIS